MLVGEELQQRRRFYIEFLADVGKKFQFDELYSHCQLTSVNENLKLKVIGYSDLIDLKISVHRTKDLEDVENLERARNIAEPKSNIIQRLIKRLFRF